MLVKRHTTHAEELVEPRDEDGVEDAEDPHPDGVDGHAGIVEARDCGANFRVRRFTVGMCMSERTFVLVSLITHSLYWISCMCVVEAAPWVVASTWDSVSTSEAV
jgi:hypothetical protein